MHPITAHGESLCGSAADSEFALSSLRSTPILLVNRSSTTFNDEVITASEQFQTSEKHVQASRLLSLGQTDFRGVLLGGHSAVRRMVRRTTGLQVWMIWRRWHEYEAGRRAPLCCSPSDSSDTVHGAAVISSCPVELVRCPLCSGSPYPTCNLELQLSVTIETQRNKA